MTFALYIKLAGQIRPFLPNEKIIFITSHVEHAIDAFKQSALWLVHGLLAELTVWLSDDLQAPRPEPDRHRLDGRRGGGLTQPEHFVTYTEHFMTKALKRRPPTDKLSEAQPLFHAAL